ncbi:hypothetical protein GQ607_006728 [Colletotrichum asianum]|uniref:Uncharacterized protein n=1 Tax=Colletotrichum asianum TaxID=702518 RepID=A0A8H3WGH7_9PEZI|nr:hypothetical protein GQ607_006728 [Colletotrichum asianum]
MRLQEVKELVFLSINKCNKDQINWTPAERSGWQVQLIGFHRASRRSHPLRRSHPPLPLSSVLFSNKAAGPPFAIPHPSAYIRGQWLIGPVSPNDSCFCSNCSKRRRRFPRPSIKNRFVSRDAGGVLAQEHAHTDGYSSTASECKGRTPRTGRLRSLAVAHIVAAPALPRRVWHCHLVASGLALSNTHQINSLSKSAHLDRPRPASAARGKGGIVHCYLVPSHAFLHNYIASDATHTALNSCLSLYPSPAKNQFGTSTQNKHPLRCQTGPVPECITPALY